MRRSGWLICFVTLSLVGMVGMGFHAKNSRLVMQDGMSARASLVRELGLSDLCLFTEARYTRHPSASDLNTAFQDHPMSFEHFPSGSLIGPPPHLTGKVQR